MLKSVLKKLTFSLLFLSKKVSRLKEENKNSLFSGIFWSKSFKTLIFLAFCLFLFFFLTPSSIESELAEKLDNIHRAHLLSRFCAKAQENLSHRDRKSLESWILTHCQILSSTSAKDESLLESLEISPSKKSDLKSQLISFLQDIDQVIPDPKENNRVAILYTGYGGGGHKAPAEAMRQKLISEGYAIEMIDIDEVEEMFEPKILGRGYEDIWREIYQQKNQPFLAKVMWSLHRWLYRPEWRETIEEIQNRLISFNPSVIFSVADHKPQLASIAYKMNRRMIFVHTDNKFSSKLSEIAEIQRLLKRPLLSFTKPTTADPISYKKTLPKISGIEKQIIDLQIPVRNGFKFIGRSEKEKIRREMGIENSVHTCLVMMGNSGIESEMKFILDRIYDERFDIDERLHFIFVCGRNQLLADELKEYRNFEGSSISIEVHGFLEGAQMAKVAQVADVWVTKMGGSTGAEALAAKKQVLSVSVQSHAWESRNALANENYGLCEAFKRNEKVLPQIVRACTKPLPHCDIPDWEEQIMEIMNLSVN
jgi:UDP-N-acetylglucosamine:LPS N-acetylglucosamine transferase